VNTLHLIISAQQGCNKSAQILPNLTKAAIT